MDCNKIYEFAVKWLAIFKDANTDFKQVIKQQFLEEFQQLKFKKQNPDFKQFIENQFISDCLELGFENRYDRPLEPCEILDEDFYTLNIYLPNDDSIELLIYIIYAKIRYYNQFDNDKKNVLEVNYKTWISEALNKMALLTLDNPYLFQGTLNEINIYSNSVVFGPMPQPDDEVYQNITIYNNSNVNFIGYTFDNSIDDNKRIKNFNISNEDKDLLFAAFNHIFSNYYEWFGITCSGDWTLELTNSDGVTFEFSDSLVAKFDYQGIDLSDLVRQVLAMDDLFVFDGKAKEDPITKVEIDYYELTNNHLNENTINYTEQLVIDRENKLIKHQQNNLDNFQIIKEYNINKGIDNFFDDYYNYYSWWYKINDSFENIYNEPYYIISVYFKRRKSRIIKGLFNKDDLPFDFYEFIKPISEFLKINDSNILFEKAAYNKKKRNKDDFIYCSIIFENTNKPYYYLTKDETLEIGDNVVVPVGWFNKFEVVKISNIEYFSREEVPFPLEQTKWIIRKASIEDIELFSSPRIDLS